MLWPILGFSFLFPRVVIWQHLEVEERFTGLKREGTAIGSQSNRLFSLQKKFWQNLVVLCRPLSNQSKEGDWISYPVKALLFSSCFPLFLMKWKLYN